MAAAAGGNSDIGIPAAVGKEFMSADKGGKLPARVSGAGDGVKASRAAAVEESKRMKSERDEKGRTKSERLYKKTGVRRG